jgi:uncharacterized RmlC-like cupin family protein
MKASNVLLVVPLVLFWSGAARAQDPVKVDPAHYKVLIDNASVRVLKVDYAPGAKSVMHQHPDSMVIPLSAAKVRFGMADGKSEDVEMASESAMFTPAGTHTPTNIGAARVDAVLVEFKGAKPGTATLPTTRPNMATKTLAESPRAVAVRTTADASFAEAAGTKHDYDQVVIALGPTPMSLSIDGKPAKTSWARGDVSFIGRGVAHESKNTSGKPVDFIIVQVK